MQRKRPSSVFYFALLTSVFVLLIPNIKTHRHESNLSSDDDYDYSLAQQMQIDQNWRDQVDRYNKNFRKGRSVYDVPTITTTTTYKPSQVIDAAMPPIPGMCLPGAYYSDQLKTCVNFEPAVKLGDEELLNILKNKYSTGKTTTMARPLTPTTTTATTASTTTVTTIKTTASISVSSESSLFTAKTETDVESSHDDDDNDNAAADADANPQNASADIPSTTATSNGGNCYAHAHGLLLSFSATIIFYLIL
jgi:hypothetical protein